MNTERQPLTDLVDDARIWDARLTEEHARPSDLAFTPNGLTVAGQQMVVSCSAWKKLLKKAGAPVGYFGKRTPSLRAAALQEHLRGGVFGSKPRLVFRDGELATIARGELVDLTFGDVLKATLDVCEGRDERLFVTRIGRSEERLSLELISSSAIVDVRPGDVVKAGIEIIHERYGVTATQIQSFIYRLVCSNGMTRKECVSNEGIARTRRLPVTLTSARELQVEQIRRLVGQTLQGLEPQLMEIRATSERPANVEELLLRWLQRARIAPRNMMPRLLAAWRVEGSETTHYGAVNALTRVGTHDQELSDRQRRVLASLGGLLAFSNVHICPRCFSVLGTASDEAEEAA
jgi:hypothetical protein